MKHPDCFKPWCGVDGKVCIDCANYRPQTRREAPVGGLPCLLPQYAACLPIIQRVARECGYAIGIHGSGQRDLDLMAVPWVERARPAAELVEAVRAAIDGVIVDFANVERNPAYRPHGRLAWSIQIGGGLYVDLSVMPPA